MPLLKISLNSDGIPVVSGIQHDLPSDAEVGSYIVQAAKQRGIDPQTALQVWSHEGRGSWQSNATYHGAREQSYGPFQLFKGGGLGNEMQKDTGLDPADPKNWKQSVDFALDHVAMKGWSAFHGAKRAGIGNYAGIRGNASPVAPAAAPGTVQSAGLAPNTSRVSLPGASPQPSGAVASAGTSAAPQFNPFKATFGQPAVPNFSVPQVDLTAGGFQPDQLAKLASIRSLTNG